jgi:hypothetical protein
VNRFSRITVEQVPAVCIWGWPDRSDLCLQAFLDTIAAAASEPVTVILPDVPAYRSFARRYARKEHMDQVARALLEEKLYRPIDGFDYNARAYVFSAEFAPREAATRYSRAVDLRQPRDVKRETAVKHGFVLACWVRHQRSS